MSFNKHTLFSLGVLDFVLIIFKKKKKNQWCGGDFDIRWVLRDYDFTRMFGQIRINRFL